MSCREFIQFDCDRSRTIIVILTHFPSLNRSENSHAGVQVFVDAEIFERPIEKNVVKSQFQV